MKHLVSMIVRSEASLLSDQLVHHEQEDLFLRQSRVLLHDKL